jgi:hypothetical protein
MGYASGTNNLYLAIRRSNKPPKLGTEVYNAIARTGTGAAATVTGVGFAPDLFIGSERTGVGYPHSFVDRLRGNTSIVMSNNTQAEVAITNGVTSFNMDGISVGADGQGYGINPSAKPLISHFFKRAVGVFDEVCYTGSNGFQDLNHSLAAVPELIIIKNRTNAAGWTVGSQAVLGISKYIVLNTTAAVVSDASYFGSVWTSSKFLVDGNLLPINQSASNYVAYLFASKAGISKVFSYTGNGTSKTIDCGFTTGARFVMIKRTDSTGDWYVWDSVRGIVASNDPHLSLNTTAAEVTTDDSVDPASAGFIVNQVSATNINVNGAAYIGLSFA